MITHSRSVKQCLFIALVVGLILGILIGPATAQGVVTSLMIDTLTPVPERDILRVQLVLTNQGSMGRLLVRLENASTNLLISETPYPVINQLEIPTDQLVNGTQYRLTIFAQSAAGQTLTVTTTNTSGQEITAQVGDLRQFTFDAGDNTSSVAVTKVLPGESSHLYALEMQQNHLDDAARFRVLVRDRGNIVVLDSTYTTPLPNPLMLDMQTLAGGGYSIVIEALAADGSLVASSQPYPFDHNPPSVSVFQTLGQQPAFIIAIALVAVFILIVLRKLLYPQGRKISPHNAALSIPQSDRLSPLDKDRQRTGVKELRDAFNKKRNEQAAWFEVLRPESIQGQRMYVYPIYNKKITIGSADNTEIRLPVEGVSRKHAVVIFDGTHYFIEDTGSTYGTFLNKTDIRGRGPQRLSSAVTVSMGNVLLCFNLPK